MPRITVTDHRKLALSLSAIVFCIGTAWYLLSGAASRNGGEMGSPHNPPTFKYEAVTGFFMQEDVATDAASFDYRKHNLGLINRPYATDPDTNTNTATAPLTQWQRFSTYLHHLLTTTNTETTYKLLYLARHGQGVHNVAEAYYGTAAWDAHWARLEGNGTATWADALLTDLGEEQAREAQAFLGEQLAWAKMPGPEAWYVSPLMRCLRTAELTFAGLPGLGGRGFRPVVKEALREVMGVHTCDRRSSRTVIREAFPQWEIEEGFSEVDELWRAEHRETFAEHDLRTQGLLDDVFARERGVVVSLTAHSGMIASLLRVMGHREFRLPTGGLMPVLVKATKVS